MRILKPVTCGDAYYCYKGYASVLVLLCVDSSGFITHSNVGHGGYAGDATVFNTSLLKERIESRNWLPGVGCNVNGVPVQPYLVADAAFAPSPHLMKCYSEAPAQQTQQIQDFNYCIIRTRRVVENAIDRLKERWTVLCHNYIRDPNLAADVATVACVLHNICERPSCLERDGVPPAHAAVRQAAGVMPAGQLRTLLTQFVHDRMH
eukprot:scpid58264/ scgid35663/ 